VNCLGFLKKSKVVPTKNNLVEAADYGFFLKLFLLHCHNNRWREKGSKPPTLVELPAPPSVSTFSILIYHIPLSVLDSKENCHCNCPRFTEALFYTNKYNLVNVAGNRGHDVAVAVFVFLRGSRRRCSVDGDAKWERRGGRSGRVGLIVVGVPWVTSPPSPSSSVGHVAV